MPNMRKLIESITAFDGASDPVVSESSMSTVANGEHFLRDVASAFGGRKGQTLDIEVTLRGSNVLEYAIQKKSLNTSVTEDLDESDAQTTFDLVRNNDMTYDEFLDWVYDIRAAAKREVE